MINIEGARKPNATLTNINTQICIIINTQNYIHVKSLTKKKTVQFYYNNLNMRFEPDEWNKIVLKSEKANFCRNLDTWQILRRSQMSFTFQFY